ncbi:hypothetical protein [Phenylobacterium sp.]|uniref:hypothetical protein n=1 Tax=Phenylobacterium sp. TaxID=1871053 RepID=UPI00121519E0|nr:hypothetical protein [Phenylobacterium sp.]THD53332.1 MAG: hypothetical protein E8A12_18735 [Phenylobacterium sp.]
MTAVSKLQIGVDVPWVTSWSEEPMLGVGPCPSVDGAIAVAQAEKPGAGRPLYSRNHLFRQRKSVREMLCPMCGKPTANGDRWCQTGRWTTAAEVRARNMGVWLPTGLDDAHRLFDAGAIAPLHRACAERALTHCPHLKAMPDHELKAFPDGWVIATLAVEARPAANFTNVPQKPVVAIAFLQLIGLPDYGG